MVTVAKLVESVDPKMDPTYKARKEAFVSNMTGSHMQDINTVSLVASVGFLSPQFTTYRRLWNPDRSSYLSCLL